MDSLRTLITELDDHAILEIFAFHHFDGPKPKLARAQLDALLELVPRSFSSDVTKAVEDGFDETYARAVIDWISSYELPAFLKRANLHASAKGKKPTTYTRQALDKLGDDLLALASRLEIAESFLFEIIDTDVVTHKDGEFHQQDDTVPDAISSMRNLGNILKDISYERKRGPKMVAWTLMIGGIHSTLGRRAKYRPRRRTRTTQDRNTEGGPLLDLSIAMQKMVIEEVNRRLRMGHNHPERLQASPLAGLVRTFVDECNKAGRLLRESEGGEVQRPFG